MNFKKMLKRVAKPARDFICALAVFGVLFGALTVDRTYPLPLPMLSLLSIAQAGETGSGAPSLQAWDAIGREVSGYTFALRPISAPPALAFSSSPSPISPSIALSLMAVLFASIVAFNLAIFRHLSIVQRAARKGRFSNSLSGGSQVASPHLY